MSTAAVVRLTGRRRKCYLYDMPLCLIECRRGLPAETKRALLDAVHAALVEAFKIPDRDRHQRFLEYAPEDFDIPSDKGDRFCVVTLDVFPGRSREAKRALYQGIVARFQAQEIPARDVMIVLREPPLDNWGLRGGVPASEIKFDFKLDV